MFGAPVYEIGCDVGTTGAFAILNVHTEELQIVPMPGGKRPVTTHDGKVYHAKVFDPNDFLDLFRPMGMKASMLKEEQRVFRGESAWSAAPLHRCDGIIDTAAAASLIPVEQVIPDTWKACIMRGRGGRRAKKPQCVAMAKQLWPAAAATMVGKSFFGTDAYRFGVADALLILYYKLLGPKVHDTRAVFNPVRCKLVGAEQTQMRLSL